MKTKAAPSRKSVKNYLYHGCGFPVELDAASLFRVGDEWILDIPYGEVERSVAEAVARKPVRLTGVEARFLRQYLERSLQGLAGRFDYSAPAVLKWERRGDAPAGMHWPVEKDLRLMALEQLGSTPRRFLADYRSLATPPEETDGPFPYKITVSGGTPADRCA